MWSDYENSTHIYIQTLLGHVLELQNQPQSCVMTAEGDLCDLVHVPPSQVQSELRGTHVHVARWAEPEPELEPELAGSRLSFVGLPVQGGSQVLVGGPERRAGELWEVVGGVIQTFSSDHHATGIIHGQFSFKRGSCA